MYFLLSTFYVSDSHRQGGDQRNKMLLLNATVKKKMNVSTNILLNIYIIVNNPDILHITVVILYYHNNIRTVINKLVPSSQFSSSYRLLPLSLCILCLFWVYVDPNLGGNEIIFWSLRIYLGLSAHFMIPSETTHLQKTLQLPPGPSIQYQDLPASS